MNSKQSNEESHYHTRKNKNEQAKQDSKVESNSNKYEKITEEIIEDKIKSKRNIDEIIEDLKNILNNEPIIKKIVQQEYFSEEDFQIMTEKKPSKFPFIVNLKNYINILNAIYFGVEKNLALFHKLYIEND